MKKQILLSLILISSSLAETPVQPGRTSDRLIKQEAIDRILNSPIRTNSNFIPKPGQDHVPALSGGAIFDSTQKPDKTQYHLFNPTPNHLLRGLSPDRPDITESPITVDAGRYQIEASFFDYRRDRGVETYTYGQVNLKAGLTHNTDLQAVIDVRSETAGDWTTFGDLTLRLKHNLWGNDGGETALGIMPYLTLPTRNEEWQGGLIVPWATDLSNAVSLGLQGQLDFIDDGSGRETQFLFTAALGYPIIGKLGGYSEYVGIIAEDRYESYYSGGFTYEISEDLVLDAGAQIGLNSDSEDFGCFTGFTQRF